MLSFQTDVSHQNEAASGKSGKFQRAEKSFEKLKCQKKEEFRIAFGFPLGPRLGFGLTFSQLWTSNSEDKELVTSWQASQIRENKG